jgi:uncharacterized protein
MIVERKKIFAAIKTALKRSPVVVLSGPRQSGKTTLARQFLDVDSVNYFDLEDPVSLLRLEEPMTALQSLEGLIVIDEIQRRPDLFPLLRVLCDRNTRPANFLILGSAGGDLLRQSSESLAGRMETVSISGFSLDELGSGNMQTLWRRGGFPPSFLSQNENDSFAWRKNFIQTLLERDFPLWGVRIPAITLFRFWTMLAHYHGQTWNAAEPARAIGVSESTCRRYLDLLTDAMMVRQLQPLHSNIAKRQVKSPKIYIRDSGLLHQLLGIVSDKNLFSHPKVGASWEGFVLEQVLLTESFDEAFFWATYQGAEIDLILKRGDQRIGIECKRADAPRMTKSIRIAMNELNLNRVVIIYPGNKPYLLSEKVSVLPVSALGINAIWA